MNLESGSFSRPEQVEAQEYLEKVLIADNKYARDAWQEFTSEVTTEIRGQKSVEFAQAIFEELHNSLKDNPLPENKNRFFSFLQIFAYIKEYYPEAEVSLPEQGERMEGLMRYYIDAGISKYFYTYQELATQLDIPITDTLDDDYAALHERLRAEQDPERRHLLEQFRESIQSEHDGGVKLCLDESLTVNQLRELPGAIDIAKALYETTLEQIIWSILTVQNDEELDEHKVASLKEQYGEIIAQREVLDDDFDSREDNYVSVESSLERGLLQPHVAVVCPSRLTEYLGEDVRFVRYPEAELYVVFDFPDIINRNHNQGRGRYSDDLDEYEFNWGQVYKDVQQEVWEFKYSLDDAGGKNLTRKSEKYGHGSEYYYIFGYWCMNKDKDGDTTQSQKSQN